MHEQIFISYRRAGGDITAKLICESLKNHGYTVFYDFDSISGGYFDERILDAIEHCNDFVLVLPKDALDRCENENDWVRQEIAYALKLNKNIIPVMLPDFKFPANLPEDIENISRVNAVQFVMAYFEGVIAAIIDRITSTANKQHEPPKEAPAFSEGLEFVLDEKLNGYAVKRGSCTDTEIIVPRIYQGKTVMAVAEGGFREFATLTKIVLPDTIKSIRKSAFYQCTLLEEANIPEKVTEIGPWAFYECSALKSVVIPQSVKSIGNRAFTGCDDVEEFQVDGRNPFYCSAEGHLYTKDKLTLINYACACREQNYIVPEGVTQIADSAFSRAAYLVKVILPDSVTDIGDFAFYNSTALKEVVLPKRLTNFGKNVFHRCNSLVSVTVPMGVQRIGEETFRECGSLQKVILPSGIQSIDRSAFNNCAKLESISIPDKVTDIGPWAFYGCKALTSVAIPKSVKNIGKRAFSNSNALANISVAMFHSAYRAQGKNLYTKDMKRLVQYAIGLKATAFAIPEGVTVVGDSSFAACTSLEKLTIPKSVTSLEDFALDNCTKLKEIYFGGTVEMWNGVQKGDKALNKVAAKAIICTNGTVKL